MGSMPVWLLRSPVRWATLGAAILFALALGAHDFGRDEAVTILVANMPLAEGLRRLARHEVNPAGYYGLMHFWPHDAEALARLPTYLAAVVTVPAVVVAARRLSISPVVAGALALSSPFFAYYAQEARSYALIVAASTLVLILTWDAIQPSAGRRPARWALAAVLAMALYLHYFAFFLAGAVLIILWRWSPERSDVTRVGAGTLLLFLPGLVMLASQLAVASTLTGHGWQPLIREPLPVWEVVRALFAGRGNDVFVVTLAVVMAALVGAGAWWSRTQRAGRFLLVFAGVQLLVPMALGTMVHLVAPWYLRGALPGLLLLAAFALQRLGPSLVVVPAALGIIVIGTAGFGDDIQKPPIRAGLAALPAGDGLPVAGSGRFATSMALYTRGDLSYAFVAPSVDYLGLWALPPGRPLSRTPRVTVFDHCGWGPAVLSGYLVEGRRDFGSDLCLYRETSIS